MRLLAAEWELLTACLIGRADKRGGAKDGKPRGDRESRAEGKVRFAGFGLL